MKKRLCIMLLVALVLTVTPAFSKESSEHKIEQYGEWLHEPWFFVEQYNHFLEDTLRTRLPESQETDDLISASLIVSDPEWSSDDPDALVRVYRGPDYTLKFECDQTPEKTTAKRFTFVGDQYGEAMDVYEFLMLKPFIELCLYAYKIYDSDYDKLMTSVFSVNSIDDIGINLDGSGGTYDMDGCVLRYAKEGDAMVFSFAAP